MSQTRVAFRYMIANLFQDVGLQAIVELHPNPNAFRKDVIEYMSSGWLADAFGDSDPTFELDMDQVEINRNGDTTMMPISFVCSIPLSMNAIQLARGLVGMGLPQRHLTECVGALREIISDSPRELLRFMGAGIDRMSWDEFLEYSQELREQVASETGYENVKYKCKVTHTTWAPKITPGGAFGNSVHFDVEASGPVIPLNGPQSWKKIHSF